jgi:hypothetical protein
VTVTIVDWRPVGSGRPGVVRARLPMPPTARLGELVRAVTARLAERFAEVLPVDVAAGPTGAAEDAVRMLHAATVAGGEGVAIESLLSPCGDGHADAACWVSPVSRYLVEREAARRAMAGRRPWPAGTASTSDGLPVAAASITVHRGRYPGQGQIERRGPIVQAALPGLDTPVRLPASLLPGWLFALTACGPRPAPRGKRLVLTSRPALDRLLGLAAAADPSAVRRALDAPDLAEEDASALAHLARGLCRHWSRAWAVGHDRAPEPADEQWSTADLAATGRLEVLDAGPAGLWRVLDDLPQPLTDDGDEEMVALVPATGAEVWDTFAALVAAPE